MIKREQQFTTLFQKWVRSVYMKKKNFCAFAFEIKHTGSKDYLNFNEVVEHQVNSLMAVNSQGLVYKISDSGIGYKCFDGFCMKSCPAYVVIKYSTFFVLIDINTFVLEKSRSKRKSLTAIRAKEIAHLIVHM